MLWRWNKGMLQSELRADVDSTKGGSEKSRFDRGRKREAGEEKSHGQNLKFVVSATSWQCIDDSKTSMKVIWGSVEQEETIDDLPLEDTMLWIEAGDVRFIYHFCRVVDGMVCKLFSMFIVDHCHCFRGVKRHAWKSDGRRCRFDRGRKGEAGEEKSHGQSMKFVVSATFWQYIDD